MVCDTILSSRSCLQQTKMGAKERWQMVATKNEISGALCGDAWSRIDTVIAQERNFLETQRVVDELGRDVGSLLDEFVAPKKPESETSRKRKASVTNSGGAPMAGPSDARAKKRQKNAPGKAKSSDKGDTAPEPTLVLGWVFAQCNSRYHCFLTVALQRISLLAREWKQQHPHDRRPAVWRDRNCRPKEFALFPSCKTKRRLVSYTWTQLSEVILLMLRAQMDGLQRELPSCSPSDGRRERMQTRVLELQREMKRVKEASADEQVRRMDEFFRLDRLKGRTKSRGKWHVCSFASDGIKLCITLATGDAPAVRNVPRLVKAGYQIPTPESPVDSLSIERGLFHVREDNMHAVMQKLCRKNASECTTPSLSTSADSFVARRPRSVQFRPVRSRP
ncbi:hypothetical protein AB1Y20_007136 [Prymnesium parvum]|uniref:Uncharacterized protein n=1 Tax=Prymnesium parvum TaxID=97485 RepID=A0AB34IUF1_PRYPA